MDYLVPVRAIGPAPFLEIVERAERGGSGEESPANICLLAKTEFKMV